MKKTMLSAALAVFAGAVSFGALQPAAAQEQNFVSIGTGGVTGVYYPTGGAICRLVNKDRREHGIRCSVESTGGSIYNINTIRSGELEFGVAQSDWQYHALHGTSEFEAAGPFEGLRAVFSVHAEPVTIIARDDSEVMNITDLKGKRLNIGNAGSGTRGTWEVIEEALGWSRDDLRLAAELKSSETGQALCDDKIDAYFWLVGHPSALTEETLSSCDAHLVNATGEAIDKLVSENSFYRAATIPAGMYNNEADVNTFGVGATFVTSADVSEEAVYVVAKAVLGNLDEFRELHPALASLVAEEMISDSLSAPLHDGAIKAYKELGLME
jgi:hypothetical protein